MSKANEGLRSVLILLGVPILIAVALGLVLHGLLNLPNGVAIGIGVVAGSIVGGILRRQPGA